MFIMKLHTILSKCHVKTFQHKFNTSVTLTKALSKKYLWLNYHEKFKHVRHSIMLLNSVLLAVIVVINSSLIHILKRYCLLIKLQI